MESVYKQAFSEVLEILKNTSKSIVEKIPENFINFLKENKDDSYIAEIDFSKSNWEDDVKQETQAIMALIYREYIVSSNKKRELIKEEQEEQIRIENEIREKYNPDNLFENEKKEIDVENINLPSEIKEETYLKKIIGFIKNFFSKFN